MKGVKGMKLLTGIMSIMFIIGIAPANVLAEGGVPMKLSYQCNLAGSGSADLTEVEMTFILYNVAGTAQTYSETQTVKVTNGIVSTIIGEIVDLESAVVDSSAWIGISINDGPVMEPKAKLTSAMYAIRARYADELTEDIEIVDGSNIESGTLPGSALQADSITTATIKDGSVSADDLADDAINSKKLTTQVITVTEESIEGAIDEYTLEEEDQGLILVSGDVKILLPVPSTENSGDKYTIKKIDDGLQRSCDGCDIDSDIVTIECGTLDDPYDLSGTTYYIEGRTHQIFLEYKNAFVTLISNGKNWYIVDSAPIQDIFAPIPGDGGTMGDVDLKANSAVTLTWTKATDCDDRRCDDCDDELSYMAYFSKGEKLTSLQIIRDSGYPCFTDWKEYAGQDIINDVCDPPNTAEAYEGTYKVNVVVKDKFGNVAPYCPPGDNIAPEALRPFWASPFEAYVNLLWNKATDNEKGTLQDELTYSVYYTKSANGRTCLSNLIKNDPPDPDTSACAIVTHRKSQAAEGTWSAVTRGEDIQTINTNQLTCDVLNLEKKTVYYFTIIVEDQAANKMQYDIVQTMTSDTAKK